HLATTAAAAGLGRSRAYLLRDLWTGASTESAGVIAATVPPHATAVYRVSPAGRDWASHPPATDVQVSLPGAVLLGGQLVVKPGQPISVTTTLTNHGVAPLLGAAATLTAPAGWQVTVGSKPIAVVV